MSNEMNLSEFSDFLKERVSGINSKLEKTIELCCKKVHDDVQYNMAHTPLNMSKSYYINNKTKAHHPSLPENPPAVDTGRLRGSINYEIHDSGQEVYGIVGSTLKEPDYAFWTEYGSTKMAPRPWLRPAMRKNNDFIRASITKAVKETLTGGN